MDKNTSAITRSIPFLGNNPKTQRFRPNPEVLECLKWLTRNKFSAPDGSGHGYAPHIGCKFEVLNPLVSCGNGNDLPVMDVGIWECTEHQFGNSALWSTFKSSQGEEIYIRVGYLPDGIHAIMAWKDNIKLL